MGPAMHMAKIIECASLCCVPGGRDPILATLEGDSFVLESMNPERRATPMSVAAHSLYEQSDPDRVAEPEGVLLVRSARYEEIDDYRRSTSPPRESSERDRGFESRFLQRGVWCEPEFRKRIPSMTLGGFRHANRFRNRGVMIGDI